MQLPNLGLYMLSCSSHHCMLNGLIGLNHAQLLNLDLQYPCPMPQIGLIHAQCLKLGLAHAKLPNFGVPMLTYSNHAQQLNLGSSMLNGPI